MALVTYDIEELQKYLYMKKSPSESCQPIGIVTLSDIFEELLQVEIYDEKELQHRSTPRPRRVIESRKSFQIRKQFNFEELKIDSNTLQNSYEGAGDMEYPDLDQSNGKYGPVKEPSSFLPSLESYADELMNVNVSVSDDNAFDTIDLSPRERHMVDNELPQSSTHRGANNDSFEMIEIGLHETPDEEIVRRSPHENRSSHLSKMWSPTSY
jgi:hypothetical protein